jgi:hypothetical protein
VIHFKTGTYSPSPAGRTLNQRLPFFYCGTIKSPPSRPYQYSEFGDAQAQFVAYSNDVSSVSKIALVGRNGLVVALAFDRNALIHGWAVQLMARGGGHKGSPSLRTSGKGSWQQAVEFGDCGRLGIHSISWNRVGTHEAKWRPGSDDTGAT